MLSPGIPGKGVVLTQLSLWWFEQLADLVPNHVVSTDVPAEVAGRAMICRRLDDVPRRVRRARVPHRVRPGGVPGVRVGDRASTLPDGLVDGSRLPEPIFTPATKAELGEHDENVPF